MQLDLIQVPGGSTNRGGHYQTISGSAGGVGGDGTGQTGLVLNDHVHIGTEAAGGQHYGLGVDRIHRVGGFGGDAGNCTVRYIQSGGLGVVHYGDVHLVQHIQEGSDQVSPYTIAVRRRVDPGYGSTAGESQLRQGGTNGIQPVDTVGGILGECLHQGGIVDAFAANHGVQSHQLGSIEVSLGIGLVGIPLLLDSSGQSGNGLVVGPLLFCGGQGVFYTLFVGELNFLLVFGCGGVHAAGGLCGVAADVGHLLHDHHVLACLLGVDGGSHTSSASADHNNIHILSFRLLVRGGDLFGMGNGQGVQICTGLGEGLPCGV